MDLSAYISQWRGQEIVAYCGPIKFRGTLEGFLEGEYLVLDTTAIMNTATGETSEFQTCVLNFSQVSGLVYQELVGRGASEQEEY